MYTSSVFCYFVFIDCSKCTLFGLECFSVRVEAPVRVYGWIFSQANSVGQSERHCCGPLLADELCLSERSTPLSIFFWPYANWREIPKKRQGNK